MLSISGQYVPIKSVVLAITEAALIVVSIWIAGWIRLGDLNPLDWEPADNLYLKFAAVSVVCLTCLYYNNLYDLHVVSRRAELLIRLIQALGAASLILAFAYYIFPSLMFGRGISAIAAFGTGLVLITWRLIVDATGHLFRPPQRILVAGTGIPGVRLVQELVAHPELNFKVLGFLDEKGENIGKKLVNPGIVGAMADLEEFIAREDVERVVLSFSERRGQMPVKDLLRVKFKGTRIEDAHSLYEKLTGRIMLDWLSPSWLILSEGFRKSVLLVSLKRAMDIIVSLAALVLLSPVLLLISLAIYLESGSPVLFRQEREGLEGRRFQMLKFRSMRQDAENQGPAWASENDSRITHVGKFLRRYRLDEIPQFGNVLRGDMSIVGPRPEQPQFVRMLEDQIPYYVQRHTVRPGITGWAQIKYKYGASSEDAKIKLEYELFYIKHMSPLFDLLIVVRTVQVMLWGLGAR